MKRIQQRAVAALLLAAAILGCLAFYILRLLREGGAWAAYSANESIYSHGVLTAGSLTDRRGVPLAWADESGMHYAEDSTLRLASLHAVGDHRGYIGTGALQLFAAELSGYSFVFGTTRPGGTVALTLDAELQKAAYNALAGRSGAVLLMNYKTGELLCMVSAPGYDPNGEPDESVEGVYLNRCISSVFTPGSVFKLVTLAAALENIPDLAERRFTCEGECTVDGNVVHCTGYHGTQTIEEALAHSCNCAFAELSLELGGETLAQYAEKYGLTAEHGFHGIATAAGSFDISPAGSAELAWSGIGQSTDLVDPYAMLRLTAAIANGGSVIEPTLLPGQQQGSSRLLRADTASALKSMMAFNVSYEYGGQASFPGLSLCAKTGTAELGDGTEHAWFTGFLSEGAPLAFTVLVERGGGGLAAAGPIANAILQKATEIYTE